jgi:hypothetical protein
MQYTKNHPDNDINLYYYMHASDQNDLTTRGKRIIFIKKLINEYQSEIFTCFFIAAWFC